MAMASADTEFNESLKPTEVTEEPFLYCNDDKIRGQFESVDAWGKWMMFFGKDELDEKWATACELYRQRKFTGIASLKVSTSFENERASDPNTGVITFYCGPAYDETLMMEYGQKLLEQFPYENDRGFMYYKSDEQTMRGTRATGQKKNSLYRIVIPKVGPKSKRVKH